MSARCADLSQAAGEELAATAVTARRWLLLEVSGTWPRDVSSESALPNAAREAVSAWLAAEPASRLQFLRRPRRTGSRSLAYVVHAEETRQEVRRLELERLEDLASVDLAGGGEPSDEQLVLVCGHGSRDRCCSLRGTAVFSALESRLGDEELWISSHQGGHRFAANVLVLPQGIQLGRVQPGEAPLVVARALAGRIELDRYRGRTCYESIVQAAEHAVRVEAELDGVEDLRLAARDGERVRFRAWDGTEWTAEVGESEGPVIPASCGDEPAPQRAFTARVVGKAPSAL